MGFRKLVLYFQYRIHSALCVCESTVSHCNLRPTKQSIHLGWILLKDLLQNRVGLLEITLGQQLDGLVEFIVREPGQETDRLGRRQRRRET